MCCFLARGSETMIQRLVFVFVFVLYVYCVYVSMCVVQSLESFVNDNRMKKTDRAHINTHPFLYFFTL